MTLPLVTASLSLGLFGTDHRLCSGEYTRAEHELATRGLAAGGLS